MSIDIETQRNALVAGKRYLVRAHVPYLELKGYFKRWKLPDGLPDHLDADLGPDIYLVAEFDFGEIGAIWELGHTWFAEEIVPPQRELTVFDLLDQIRRTIRTRDHISREMQNMQFRFSGANSVYIPGLDLGGLPRIIHSAAPYYVWHLAGHKYWAGMGHQAYAGATYYLVRVWQHDLNDFRADTLLEIEPGRRWKVVKNYMIALADRLQESRQHPMLQPGRPIRAP